MMTTLPINARLARLGAVVAGFALALTTPGISAHAADDTAAANKAAITRSFEAWAAGTGGPYDLLSDDVQWTIPGRSMVARTYPSREAFLSEVIRPFNARMRQPLNPVLRDRDEKNDTCLHDGAKRSDTRAERSAADHQARSSSIASTSARRCGKVSGSAP